MAVKAPRLTTRKSVMSLRSPMRSRSSSYRRSKDAGTSPMLRSESPALDSDSGESDLDIDVSLEELAERSGIFDEIPRGAKRKAALAQAKSPVPEVDDDPAERPHKPLRRLMLPGAVAARPLSESPSPPRAAPKLRWSGIGTSRPVTPDLASLHGGRDDNEDEDWLNERIEVSTDSCVAHRDID